MGTPLGDFVRAKRDSLQPASLGLPDSGRRRAPGLRRTDLATRAGISVEYLTRIEQGRDRNPSPAVVNSLADALALDLDERNHLRYLAKITGGGCPSQVVAEPPDRDVRPSVLETLRLLEPGVAVVTNRLGEILAHTSGYEAVVEGSGLLESDTPNLTRYVFTDPRAKSYFADWDEVANEQVFDLVRAPSAETAEWLITEVAAVAGEEFTRRLDRHLLPPRGVLGLNHPAGHRLRLARETLELAGDAQQLVVHLAADPATEQALGELRHPPGRLRSIS